MSHLTASGGGFFPLPTKQHITSIDQLRGLVMLIMAIDHVRDALHKGYPEPTDPGRDNAHFIFYQVDHSFLCANFCISKRDRRLSGRSEAYYKRSFAITLNPHYSYLVLQVIWAIGGSMILLGLYSSTFDVIRRKILSTKHFLADILSCSPRSPIPQYPGWPACL